MVLSFTFENRLQMQKKTISQQHTLATNKRREGERESDREKVTTATCMRAANQTKITT